MAREFSRAFYHSKGWKTARAAYMKSTVRTLDGRICPPGMCERCFERGKLVPAEIVHHVIPITETNINDSAVTFSFGNLMRVCRDCHADLHYGGSGYTPRVSFDENGRVIPLA